MLRTIIRPRSRHPVIACRGTSHSRGVCHWWSCWSGQTSGWGSTADWTLESRSWGSWGPFVCSRFRRRTWATFCQCCGRGLFPELDLHRQEGQRQGLRTKLESKVSFLDSFRFHFWPKSFFKFDSFCFGDRFLTEIWVLTDRHLGAISSFYNRVRNHGTEFFSGGSGSGFFRGLRASVHRWRWSLLTILGSEILLQRFSENILPLSFYFISLSFHDCSFLFFTF